MNHRLTLLNTISRRFKSYEQRDERSARKNVKSELNKRMSSTFSFKVVLDSDLGFLLDHKALSDYC